MKGRSASRRAHRAQGLADCRRRAARSRARVSGSRVQTRTVEQRSPTTVRTTNTPRQSVTRRIWPPISGATTGATPEISMRVEKKRAIATPSYRSRTTARAMTIPAAPARPCDQPEGDQELDGGRERAQRGRDDVDRRARPAAGVGGPTGRSSGRPPAARAPCPSRQAVRVSWTVAAGACRAPVTSGSAGRYMSIASGGRRGEAAEDEGDEEPGAAHGGRRPVPTSGPAACGTAGVGASCSGMCPSLRAPAAPIRHLCSQLVQSAEGHGERGWGPG